VIDQGDEVASGYVYGMEVNACHACRLACFVLVWHFHSEHGLHCQTNLLSTNVSKISHQFQDFMVYALPLWKRSRWIVRFAKLIDLLIIRLAKLTDLLSSMFKGFIIFYKTDDILKLGLKNILMDYSVTVPSLSR
jgi:hypothetical protein